MAATSWRIRGTDILSLGPAGTSVPRGRRASCDHARRSSTASRRSSGTTTATTPARPQSEVRHGPGYWIVVAADRAVAACAGRHRTTGSSGSATWCEESWRQIDVELNRRHDLIPNLVETVKGYAAHERAVLETADRRPARRRAAHRADGPAARRATRTRSAGARAVLFAVAEAYPDLKASANFLAAAEQLAKTEDRIAAARRFYNGNVRASTPGSRRSRPTSSPARSASPPRSSSSSPTSAPGARRRSRR